MHARTTWTALALASLAGLAPAETYDDEAAWQAAVGGHFRTEDFEGFANLTSVTQLPSVLLYLNRLEAKNAAPTVMATSTTGGTSTSGSSVLVNQSQPVLPGLGPIRSSDTGTSAAVFNGIVTNIPVGWVEIDAGSLGNGYFTLDDLQVAFSLMPDASAGEIAEWGEETGLGGEPAAAAAPGWTPAPGTVGVVHAIRGAPASPGGWAGPVGAHPLSVRVALVRADARGRAALPLETCAQALGGLGSPWTLQVLWAERGRPRPGVVRVLGPDPGAPERELR